MKRFSFLWSRYNKLNSKFTDAHGNVDQSLLDKVVDKRMAFVNPALFLGMTEHDIRQQTQDEFLVSNEIAERIGKELKTIIAKGVSDGVLMALGKILGQKGGK
ncbi:hypothetical protein [Levilactobacillus brevis]|nr:hypothetical protein [Levilactobacillus brevis]